MAERRYSLRQTRSRKPFSSSIPHDDRLSDLSDDLLHQILSNCDLKQTIQTSILSKRWRYFWTTISSLHFDSDYLTNSYKSIQFDDIVTQVLDHGCKNSNLNTLRIISNEPCKQINIQTWIQSAVNCNVQILDIQLHQPRSWPIHLPPSLFTCQSLKFLELVLNMHAKGKAIWLPVQYSVNLPHLKELRLCGVRRLSTQFLDKIFSGCPLLEMLVITNFTFDKSRSLVITSNVLKRLVILMDYDEYIDHECQIVVHTPNLKSFKCIDWSSNNYHLKDVSSLETMYLNNEVRTYALVDTEAKVQDANRYVKWLQEICRVKSLTLAPYNLEVVSQYVDSFHRAHISFSNLSYLNVTMKIDKDYVRAVKWMLMNSPNIGTLIIKNVSRSNSAEICDKWGDSLSFQNLKCVELHFVEGFNNELGLLKGLLKNAMKLEEMTIFTPPNIHKNNLEFFKKNVMNFPRISTRLKISFRRLWR